ncbi:hypothetical protein HS088_TW13G01089 [Tripterygium wilfordii]|uniref:Uncharacterized protein n=1 Tax=Tripterygium wilfordii TaxID=458696 RepID=A0A7J7CVU7_TRIWF|nr:hypothetical protein HS088_TW13G01089 [Tripterygium wilfordii]
MLQRDSKMRLKHGVMLQSIANLWDHSERHSREEINLSFERLIVSYIVIDMMTLPLLMEVCFLNVINTVHYLGPYHQNLVSAKIMCNAVCKMCNADFTFSDSLESLTSLRVIL